MNQSTRSNFYLAIIPISMLFGILACNLTSPEPEDIAGVVGDAEMPEEYEQLPDGMMETATAAAMMLEIPDTPELPEIPTLESQVPSELGEGVPGFPADVPIPAGWTPAEVPPFLEAEGYVVAFTYDGMAEEVAVDFSAVLLGTGSWIMDELTPSVYASTYILPFGNMSTGFTAHAFITTNAVAIEMEELEHALVAFRLGPP